MVFPKVSVIIPAKNEEKYIEALLNHLREQDYPNFEIIVVDNGSTDSTFTLAQEKADLVLEDTTAKISGLRNLGAKKSTGDILAFIDADCIPSKNWLHQGVKSITKPEVGLTGSHCKIPKGATWVEKAWYQGKAKGVRDVRYLGTANLFVWKKIFDYIGGFNETLISGEDYELCLRVKKLNFRVVSDDTIESIHLRGPKTLLERLKKEIWYGKETKSILKYNRYYRPFFASLFFTILVFYSFISIVLLSSLNTLMGLSLLMLLILFVSFVRCLDCGNFRFFFHLIPIYAAYLAGRSMSLIYLFK